jgi:hypothetical protein
MMGVRCTPYHENGGGIGEMSPAATFNYKQVLLAILLVGAKVLSLDASLC